ncbi:MAG: bifunctional folylpolyglutamate synthase/dihydrofolate synthase [Magnetococcales bacterium]|nr:bifunctional folylpolyglutamate synthase/dihydrofolate synthase [Magnetococcales bacterium]
MTHPDAAERLLSQASQFSDRRIRLGLGRMRRLLNELGNPEHALDAIHVAGTNGKGSTVAFLEAMLRQANYETGVYTSPHLQRFNERIRHRGRAIDDASLELLLTTVLQINAGQPATFFELTTAVALLHFSRLQPPSPPGTRWHACQRYAAILETGLGGRLDATNVVQPRLVLLTPVGLDHQEYLGDTLTRIAREKAGILKPGVPAVADPGSAMAAEVILKRAEHLGAPLWLRQRDYRFDLPDGSGLWHYQDSLGSLALPPPRLLGRHQYGNAALALAGLRLLSTQLTCPWHLSNAAMQEGVAQAWLPGRLECFPGTPPIWLDGAHNLPGAQVLAAALADMEPMPTHLIFSALRDKDMAGMAKILAPSIDRVWIAPLAEQRAADPQRMAQVWQQQGLATTLAADPASALHEARKLSPPHGRILVCGSLHLVGSVRDILSPPSNSRSRWMRGDNE